MLRRIGRGILWAIPGYLAGAFVGYQLIIHLSSNVHDKSIEASMTSALMIGPVCGLVAFIVGASRGRERT